MIFDRFHAPDARHRRDAMARRPQLESMEERQMLSGVPYVTINSPLVVEGTGKNTPVTFTVNLTSASTQPVVLSYETVDMLATSGSDFVATKGTLTFNPGERAKTITVQVIGDDDVETTEAFGLRLSNAKNATLVNPLGVATIMDDDKPVAPTLTVGDIQMTRGLNGTRDMVFTISLNRAQTTPVSVTAATSNATAVAGKDYLASTQYLTFQPGETTKRISVTILGTSTPTADKILLLKLTNSSVTLSRASAAGVLKFGA